MEGLLLIYAVVVALELVLSIVMLLILLMALAPVGRQDDEPAAPERRSPGTERFPDDLSRSLRLAFQELSKGSGDVALMVHTRALLQRHDGGESSRE